MKTERGLSINNPNESWLESKGTWFTYVLLITIGHLVILSVPFLDTPTAWTLTNTFHNLSIFIFLHYLKGTPFQMADQGKARDWSTGSNLTMVNNLQKQESSLLWCQSSYLWWQASTQSMTEFILSSTHYRFFSFLWFPSFLRCTKWGCLAWTSTDNMGNILVMRYSLGDKGNCLQGKKKTEQYHHLVIGLPGKLFTKQYSL